MTPYRLEFELPGLPKMANPSGAKSTHWRYAYEEVSRWHMAVVGLVARRRPAKPLDRYTLELTRFSSSEPDYDGLVRGFKSIVDGLRLAGVIVDDKLSNSGPWVCDWMKAKPKEGKIKVVVIEKNTCIPYAPGISELKQNVGL
jgi:hypothetical protein